MKENVSQLTIENTGEVANTKLACSLLRPNAMVAFMVTMVLLVASIPTFKGLWGLWHLHENFDGFMFVPFLCGLILYQRRSVITSIAPKPTKTCLYILLLGLVAMTATAFWGYPRMSGILFVVNVLLATAGLVGIVNLPTLMGPILFLILMVPPPLELMDAATINLQRLFSVSLEIFLNAFCSQFAERTGIVFWFSNQLPSIVAPECSGIRSLIGFTISSLFLVAWDRQKVWTMFFLLTSGIMIALIMNFARITITVYLRVYGFGEYAVGFWHGLLGILVYVIGFYILRELSDLLKNGIRLV